MAVASSELNKIKGLECSKPLIVAADINRRIRVYWDKGEVYDGVVDKFSSERGILGQGHVLYDDGDDEWIDCENGDIG